MGNLVLYPRSNSCISSVVPNLIMLTKCKINSGLREDILKVFKNYIYYIGKNFFISRSELRRISKHSSLGGIEEVVFTYFLRSPHKKVNIMEILAGLIVYSFQEFEAKISIAIQIFDFDGSKNLTEDEFFIMMKCFISAISIMTGGIPAEKEVIKSFVSSLYTTRNELKSNEIIVWVRQNPVLYEMFQINQPEMIKPVKIIKKKLASLDFRTFDNRGTVAVHRRIKSSYSVKRENNYSVVIDSKIVTKHDVLTLKNKFDEKCKNGWCSLKEAVVVVKGLGYLIDSSIDCESTVLVSFNNLLEILFKNANKNQINRLLRFSGMKIIEERIKEPEKNLTVRNIIDPRQVLMFKNIFERYDLNKDGKVDLKELKNLLKNSLNEESIEEMYEKYRRGSKGLNLEEFIKMHAPDDVEVPENLNIS